MAGRDTGRDDLHAPLLEVRQVAEHRDRAGRPADIAGCKAEHVGGCPVERRDAKVLANDDDRNIDRVEQLDEIARP